jgi:hypothetical protein
MTSRQILCAHNHNLSASKLPKPSASECENSDCHSDDCRKAYFDHLIESDDCICGFKAKREKGEGNG